MYCGIQHWVVTTLWAHKPGTTQQHYIFLVLFPNIDVSVNMAQSGAYVKMMALVRGVV